MPASQQQIILLSAVNEQINAIPYDAVPKAGEEADTWIDAPDGGEWECRDYTIAKAKDLRNRGWPVSDMSVVLCNDELGEYHAVLACNAGGDIYVLDNRTPGIYLWNEPVYAYTWLHQQIPGSTDFRDASTGLV